MTEDCFHLGIKGLICNSEGKVLLLRVNQKKLDNTKRSYWDIPGGRIQRGETIETALRREIAEETGISKLANIKSLSMVLSNIRIPQKNGPDVGLVLWVFTCDASSLDDITLSDEHIALHWFDLSEAIEKLRFKYPEEFIEKLGTPT